MKPVLIDLFTSKKFLAALAAIVIYVAGRFGLSVDPATLDRIFAAFLVYIGAQGLADNGKSAAAINAVSASALDARADRSEIGSPAASAQDAMRRVAGTVSTVLVVALGVVALGMTMSCTAARQRTGAGVAAFLDCEAPHVDQAVLSETKTLAAAAVSKWISGSGKIDAAGLRAAAAPLKTDLLRCAFDAAVAALLTPVPASPGAPASSQQAVDAEQVRAAWSAVRGELAWPPEAM